MNKIFFALVLGVSSLSVFGSGSDTVFRELSDYYVTSDIDEARSLPGISVTLDELDFSVLVVKVSASFYVETACIVSHGYEVSTKLDDGTDLSFRWDGDLESIIANGRDGSLYILSP